MNYIEIMRRLCKEKREWQNSAALGHEVRWIVRGIDLCIKHIRDIGCEKTRRDLLLHPILGMNASGELYHAIEVALKYLSRGERSKGIERLQEAKKKFNPKVLIVILLLLCVPSLAIGMIGGNCDTGGPVQRCGAGPGTCGAWIGTVYPIWTNCGSPAACLPDASSPTGYSQATPTRHDMYQETGPCGCSTFGLCSCGNTLVSTGICTGVCTLQCSPPLVACTGFTPWASAGCGGPACLVGQQHQTRSAVPAGCHGSLGPFTQCVPDPTCTPPVIFSFAAAPPTVVQGNPSTLSWNVVNTATVTISGIGTFPAIGSISTAPAATTIFTLTASNDGGTLTSNATVTVTLPPRCGVWHICGTITAAENSAIVLPGVPVNVMDKTGYFLETVKTDASGIYDWTAPGPNQYIVHAVTGRTQSSNHLGVTVTPNNIIGTADFTIHAVPANVKINAVPGTFVMFSTYSYTAAHPPTIKAGMTLMIFDGMADSNGAANVELPGPYIYWVTCWKHLGYGLGWGKGASAPLNGGNPVWPLDHITQGCP